MFYFILQRFLLISGIWVCYLTCFFITILEMSCDVTTLTTTYVAGLWIRMMRILLSLKYRIFTKYSFRFENLVAFSNFNMILICGIVFIFANRLLMFKDFNHRSLVWHAYCWLNNAIYVKWYFPCIWFIPWGAVPLWSRLKN